MKMTIQQVFNKVARHLLRQGKESFRSVDGNDVCAYRGRGGLKCAAGVLILDKHYKRSLEGQGVCASDDVRAALNASGVPNSAFPLVSELQCIHDGDVPADWAGSLAYVARNRGLSPAVLDEFAVKP